MPNYKVIHTKYDGNVAEFIFSGQQNQRSYLLEQARAKYNSIKTSLGETVTLERQEQTFSTVLVSRHDGGQV